MGNVKSRVAVDDHSINKTQSNEHTSNKTSTCTFEDSGHTSGTSKGSNLLSILSFMAALEKAMQMIEDSNSLSDAKDFSISDVLNDDDSKAVYLEFLHKEYGENNLHFFMEVNAIKNMDGEEVSYAYFLTNKFSYTLRVTPRKFYGAQLQISSYT